MEAEGLWYTGKNWLGAQSQPTAEKQLQRQDVIEVMRKTVRHLGLKAVSEPASLLPPALHCKLADSGMLNDTVV